MTNIRNHLWRAGIPKELFFCKCSKKYEKSAEVNNSHYLRIDKTVNDEQRQLYFLPRHEGP